MKTLIQFTILGLILLCGYYVITRGVGPELISIELDIRKYKAEVGNTYIVGNDTLVILKYNLILDTYALSNGTELDASSLHKFKKVKDVIK